MKKGSKKREETGMLFSGKDLRRLIAITVGMADTMMISSVGEAAVSGVSLVDMVNILINSNLSALCTGGAVVTSQYIGAGKKETTDLAYILVMIHNGIGILMWPASFVLPNMLRACNDVKFTMVVSIFSMLTFRICFSYIPGVDMEMGAILVYIKVGR